MQSMRIPSREGEADRNVRGFQEYGNSGCLWPPNIGRDVHFITKAPTTKCNHSFKTPSLGYKYKECTYHTIFLLDKGFVDDIVIISILVDLEVVHIKLDGVDHRNPTLVITRRARCPVSRKICEHVDMITKEVDYGLSN
jgi:hypothetical protein